MARPSRGAEALPAAGPAELVMAVYLLATIVLQVVFRANQRDWAEQIGTHLLVLAGVAALFLPAWTAAPAPVRRLIGILRVWYPLPVFPLLYAHVGQMVHIVNPGYIDGQLIALEQKLFGHQPSIVWAEGRPQWLAEVMLFAYGSYWWYGPLTGCVIHLRAGRQAARRFVFVVTFTMLSCYLAFQLLPAMGPRFALSHAGAELLDGSALVRFVNGVVTTNGLRGAAFPSSHVAVMLAVVWGAWRSAPRPLAWIGTALCALLTVSVVYGRFHYALDAIAGVIAGIVLALIAEAWAARTPLRRVVDEGRVGR